MSEAFAEYSDQHGSQKRTFDDKPMSRLELVTDPVVAAIDAADGSVAQPSVDRNNEGYMPNGQRARTFFERSGRSLEEVQHLTSATLRRAGINTDSRYY